MRNNSSFLRRSRLRQSPRIPHAIFTPLGILLLLLLLLPSPLFSYELAKAVQTFTLKNGLRLLLLERHISPTVAIYIRYRAGAVDEADGKTGTAHLLEHMMFKGTRTIGTRNYAAEKKLLLRIEQVGTALDREKAKGKAAHSPLIERLTAELTALHKQQRRFTLSNEIDRLYSENGAVGLNASTGQDLTTYQVSIPANRIELWARIEADRMVHPVFRQRSESDPEGKLLESYLAAAFISHPYRRPILGWPSDMRNLDIAYMSKYFRNMHAPNNTVIAMVGDLQPSTALKIVEKYFSRISAQKLTSPPITEEQRQSGERRVEVIFDAEPQMILGYHKPPPPVFADYLFDMIESILTKGRTSRLFKTLVQEKGVAESIQAANGLPGSRYPNQFVIFATPRHPHTLGELEQAIDREIERLQREPVSESELEKVKNQIRADFIRGLDSNAGLAGMLSYYEALLGDYRYLAEYTATIDRITPDDILQAARTYLTPENRTVAALTKKH
jgi:predicted Zn-dependent peptidase